MTNLDSILKSRDITLPTKVLLFKAMVFPLVMYGCESWTIKKAECRRIDAFDLWCWRRLLRVPWTARRSNQFILKEISPECSLEGLMLKLKFQYFGHLIWSAGSLEKTLMLWKIEGRRRRGWQRMRLLDSITDRWTWVLVTWGSWWWAGGLSCCGPWGGNDSDTTEWLNWTEPQAIVERFASQRTPLLEWKRSIISFSLPMQRAQLQRKQDVFHKVLLPFLLLLKHKMI